MNWTFKFATELTGTAPQIRMTDGATDYDITIPAGLYAFGQGSTGGTVDDIITTIDGLIDAAISARTWITANANGRMIDFDDDSGAYTLRLLDCDDAEPLAMLLGLYGDDYDWEHYQTHDAPATWRVSGACCWFASGYDHNPPTDEGWPVWSVDHRVTESGAAVHLPQARRSVLPLTLKSVTGTTLRGDWTDGAYGTGATDSVSLLRAYDPELRLPLVHITCGSRWSGWYYLHEPITEDSIARRFDRWSGYYSLNLQIGAADV